MKFEQNENETRKEFLVRIAIYYLEDTGMESFAELEYDGAVCDAYCLSEDLKIEFNID